MAIARKGRCLRLRSNHARRMPALAEMPLTCLDWSWRHADAPVHAEPVGLRWRSRRQPRPITARSNTCSPRRRVGPLRDAQPPRNAPSRPHNTARPHRPAPTNRAARGDAAARADMPACAYRRPARHLSAAAAPARVCCAALRFPEGGVGRMGRKSLRDTRRRGNTTRRNGANA